MKVKKLTAGLFLAVLCGTYATQAGSLLVEAETFDELGGWIVDSQFIDQMGSSYLMAHGLGKAVSNASTKVEFPETGEYHVWVRTKDWVKEPEWSPGKFKLLINGQAQNSIFGTQGSGNWIWQKGGTTSIENKSVKIELEDLAGFNGRCDAIFFTTDKEAAPPQKHDESMRAWRRQLLNLPSKPKSGGKFDVIVVGGGVSGCSAALAAARLGCRVAIIQNRTVFGGNSSSEVGVRGFKWGVPSDVITREVWDRVGFPELINRRREAMTSQPNLTCFLGWHVTDATMKDGRISSVRAIHTITSEERTFDASYWIDASGDGALGFLAGADYRYGRESRHEHNEPLAPEKPDRFVLGATLHWGTHAISEEPRPFPEVPWALIVSKDYAGRGGSYSWEYGHWRDMIGEAEEIRDYLFQAIYGSHYTAKKNEPDKLESYELKYIHFVLAKRESRRLLGDYIMTALDCWETPTKPDRVGISNNPFDVHKPKENYDFRIYIDETYGGLKRRKDADIPFRSLYSRNVPNLLMAGRCISVTHLAHSSTRVMNTGSQTGIASGAASYLCTLYNKDPREVGKQHIKELQDIVFNRNDYEGALKKP